MYEQHQKDRIHKDYCVQIETNLDNRIAKCKTKNKQAYKITTIDCRQCRRRRKLITNRTLRYRSSRYFHVYYYVEKRGNTEFGDVVETNPSWCRIRLCRRNIPRHVRLR